MRATFVPSFVALSYVWGPFNGGASDETIRDCLPNDIEVVVEDALHVTLELGYDYLWVDRHCILQKDGPMKQEQLRNMDLIYREAEVTIVAAA